jgi:outer membrane protein TolC
MNMRTVNQIGIQPPLGLILEARLLFDGRDDIIREVTLRSTMDEAVQVNLSLAIEDKVVDAGRQNVRLANAQLLPSVSAGFTGTTIAASVAEVAGGTSPQYNLEGALTAQQVIFSEPVWANRSVQRSLQRSREWNRSAVKLDITLQAAEAYLNLLRAKSLESIQRENLALTRTSLRLAEAREQIGAAGPGERLRLQSELAQRRGDAINAHAQRYAAEVALNQVLNRPLSEEFRTPEADIDSRELMEGTLRTAYLKDLSHIAILADFLTKEALESSPEIRSLDEALVAQNRLLGSATSAYFLPTIALQAKVSTNLAKDGAGSTIPGEFDGVTDFPWSVAITGSLPLFEGTARSARKDQSSIEVARLQLQRDLLAQGLEQRVRTELQFAQASFAIVSEAEAAAVAARRSLELVTDSYGQGLVGVVDLLEAQTRALVADRNVANAIYDDLIRLKRVERAVGSFEALRTQGEQQALVERLRQYFEGVGEQ